MEKLITDIAAVLASDQQVLYKQLQEEAAAERKNIRAKTEWLPLLDAGIALAGRRKIVLFIKTKGSHETNHF